MCDIVQIRSYNVKSHWKVQGLHPNRDWNHWSTCIIQYFASHQPSDFNLLVFFLSDRCQSVGSRCRHSLTDLNGRNSACYEFSIIPRKSLSNHGGKSHINLCLFIKALKSEVYKILRGNVWENQRGPKISRYNVYLKFAWWNYQWIIHEYFW